MRKTQTRSPARAGPPPARRPSLRFTPYAWAKLTFLRDLGPTEIGGFGVSAESDPLLVEDVRLVRQLCTSVTVSFVDEAVADYFDACVDQGLSPDRFARVWIHTHPGASPRPSRTDEETFAAAFGRTDWAVMFVLAKEGEKYGRLRFHVGPGGEIELPATVDFASEFGPSDRRAWEAEYAACVQPEEPRPFDLDEFDRRGWFQDPSLFSRKEVTFERAD